MALPGPFDVRMCVCGAAADTIRLAGWENVVPKVRRAPLRKHLTCPKRHLPAPRAFGREVPDSSVEPRRHRSLRRQPMEA